jgi:hypothetical protein
MMFLGLLSYALFSLDRKKFCRFYQQNYAPTVPISPVLDALADTTVFLLLLCNYESLFCAVNEGMPSSINVSFLLHLRRRQITCLSLLCSSNLSFESVSILLPCTQSSISKLKCLCYNCKFDKTSILSFEIFSLFILFFIIATAYLAGFILLFYIIFIICIIFCNLILGEITLYPPEVSTHFHFCLQSLKCDTLPPSNFQIVAI